MICLYLRENLGVDSIIDLGGKKMGNYNPNTNHIDNPLQTKLQEVIFDLYDNKQTDLAQKLEEIEVEIFKVKETEDA